MSNNDLTPQHGETESKTIPVVVSKPEEESVEINMGDGVQEGSDQKASSADQNGWPKFEKVQVANEGGNAPHVEPVAPQHEEWFSGVQRNPRTNHNRTRRMPGMTPPMGIRTSGDTADTKDNPLAQPLSDDEAKKQGGKRNKKPRSFNWAHALMIALLVAILAAVLFQQCAGTGVAEDRTDDILNAIGDEGDKTRAQVVLNGDITRATVIGNGNATREMLGPDGELYTLIEDFQVATVTLPEDLEEAAESGNLGALNILSTAIVGQSKDLGYIKGVVRDTNRRVKDGFANIGELNEANKARDKSNDEILAELEKLGGGQKEIKKSIKDQNQKVDVNVRLERNSKSRVVNR